MPGTTTLPGRLHAYRLRTPSSSKPWPSFGNSPRPAGAFASTAVDGSGCRVLRVGSLQGPNLSAFHDLLAEELNVEPSELETDLDRFQRIELAPNFRALAPKARAEVNNVANAIRNAEDPEALLTSINDGGADVLGVLVEPSDVEVKRLSVKVLPHKR